MPNISRSKGNQTMKFNLLIEYNKRSTFFFKSHAEKEAERIALDLFLFFKKTSYEVRTNDLQLSISLDGPELGIQ